MIELLNNFWFLLFVSITIIIPSVVVTIAQTWQKIRQAQIDAALKQEMLRRGLSVEEIERLCLSSSLPPPSVPKHDEETVAVVARVLMKSGCPAAEMEKAVSLVQAADPQSKQVVSRAISEVESEVEEPNPEQLLAVIRGICSPLDLSGKEAVARGDANGGHLAVAGPNQSLQTKPASRSFE